MTVPSPCISVCVLDEASGFCKGCRRTMEEITMWPYLTDAQKSAVREKLPSRPLPPEA